MVLAGLVEEARNWQLVVVKAEAQEYVGIGRQLEPRAIFIVKRIKHTTQTASHSMGFCSATNPLKFSKS